MARQPQAGSIRLNIKMSDLVKKQFDQISNLSFLRNRTVQQIGQSVINKIVERTQRGVSAEGRRFPGYSAKWKAKRSNSGLQTAYADLTFYGDMLSGLHVDRVYANRSFRISVDRKDRPKAHGAHEGYGQLGHKLRPFLGLTGKDKIEINREVASLIQDDYDRYLRTSKR